MNTVVSSFLLVIYELYVSLLGVLSSFFTLKILFSIMR